MPASWTEASSSWTGQNISSRACRHRPTVAMIAIRPLARRTMPAARERIYKGLHLAGWLREVKLVNGSKPEELELSICFPNLPQ